MGCFQSPTPPDWEGLIDPGDEVVVLETVWNETEFNCTTDLGGPDLTLADWALVTLFCSIIAVCVVGNTLVIAAVVTTRRLRTVTNCFVMSLALADWTVGCFVMPPKIFLYLTNNEWRLGWIICELWISLDILLCTASILSLLTISIDRYLAITRPLAYSRKRRSKRLAFSMISCVWVAAAIITSPPFFGWYDPNKNLDKTCEYNQNKSYVIYSAMGSFFLPLFLMVYVYARIACVITKRQKTIRRIQNRGSATAVAISPEDNVSHFDDASLSIAAPGPGGGGGRETPPAHGNADFDGEKPAGFRRICCCSGGGNDSRGSSQKRFKGSSPTSPQEPEDAMEDAPQIGRSRSFLRRTFPRGGRSRPRPKEVTLLLESSKYGDSNGSLRSTGSRLCHHHISAESPEARVRRVQSSRDPRGNGVSPRIWTVEEGQDKAHNKKVSIEGGGGEVKREVKLIERPLGPSSLKGSRINGGPVERNGSGKFRVQIQEKEPTTRVNSGGSVKYFNKDYSSQGGRIASFRRETKTAQTLFCIMAGFVFCWLPFFVVYIISPFIDYEVPLSIYDALIWLGWGNSAINPFIYAFYSVDFRNAFWRLTLGHCFKGPSNLPPPRVANPIGGLRANLPAPKFKPPILR